MSIEQGQVEQSVEQIKSTAAIALSEALQVQREASRKEGVLVAARLLRMRGFAAAADDLIEQMSEPYMVALMQIGVQAVPAPAPVEPAPRVDIARVMKVYSGRKGKCMCGCAGRYRCASALRAEAQASRGYAFDDNEVSDQAVARVVKILNEDPRTVIEPDHAWVDQGNMSYVAYFAKGE